MINFNDVLQKYPKRLQGFKEYLIKEYLQYKILDIIYSSKYAENLILLGGTAIRIVHQGMRFSEDLDFDNLRLQEQDFKKLAQIIEKELSLDGYEVEIKNVLKGAYHCYIRFPGLLFEHGLSGHKQQRILIQIDVEPQSYDFNPDKFLINQFGIFRYINTVPGPLLLSQKIFTCLNRKRAKGRDFFDVVFLMSKAKPDYRYLSEKVGIHTKEEMVDALKKRIDGINMASLAQDVEPFLFDRSQKDRIVLFEKWLDSI